jgi:hypothetical protein
VVRVVVEGKRGSAVKREGGVGVWGLCGWKKIVQIGDLWWESWGLPGVWSRLQVNSIPEGSMGSRLKTHFRTSTNIRICRSGFTEHGC